MPDTGLAERVERIEAHLAIQQLPIRYAMAVDGSDIDAWLRLLPSRRAMGRHGTGREALRRTSPRWCAGSTVPCTRSAGTAST